MVCAVEGVVKACMYENKKGSYFGDRRSRGTIQKMLLFSYTTSGRGYSLFVDRIAAPAFPSKAASNLALNMHGLRRVLMK